MARNTPTELVGLELAAAIQAAVSAPDDLKQKIIDLYALSEGEQKKADEARSVIAQADAFLADLKAKQDALANIDARIAEAKKLEAFNEDTLKAIADRGRELDAQEKANTQDEIINGAEVVRLEKWKGALEVREAKLVEDEANIAVVKSDLKKRAEIVGLQVANL